MLINHALFHSQRWPCMSIVIGRIMSLKDACALIPEICEYVIIRGKGILQMRLRAWTLRYRYYSGLARWAQLMNRLKRGIFLAWVREMAEKEGEKIPRMRGTWPIFAGFEDGGQKQEPRNVDSPEKLETVLGSQPTKKGGLQTNNPR